MTSQELSEFELFSEVPIILLIDEEYKKEFKTFFQLQCPKLYADIESLYLNGPTCSCKSKIRNYAEQNKLQVAEIIVLFFKKINQPIDNILNRIESNAPQSISGRILKTTVAKWPHFAKEMLSYEYKSFSVVKEGDDILVFFL